MSIGEKNRPRIAEHERASKWIEIENDKLMIAAVIASPYTHTHTHTYILCDLKGGATTKIDEQNSKNWYYYAVDWPMARKFPAFLFISFRNRVFMSEMRCVCVRLYLFTQINIQQKEKAFSLSNTHTHVPLLYLLLLSYQFIFDALFIYVISSFCWLFSLPFTFVSLFAFFYLILCYIWLIWCCFLSFLFTIVAVVVIAVRCWKCHRGRGGSGNNFYFLFFCHVLFLVCNLCVLFNSITTTKK